MNYVKISRKSPQISKRRTYPADIDTTFLLCSCKFCPEFSGHSAELISVLALTVQPASHGELAQRRVGQSPFIDRLDDRRGHVEILAIR